MDSVIKILHLEDSTIDAEIIKREFYTKARFTYDLKRVENREQFIQALDEFHPNIILADYDLPSFDGMEALRIVKKKELKIPFVFVTGTLGEDLAVETIKRGATDYILKDNLSRLVHCVKRALQEAEDRKKIEETERAVHESERNYRTLADSGRALIWTSGTDMLCNYFNQVWLEFTGRTLEQETGIGWSEGIHHEDLQRYMDTYVKAFDQREKFSAEYRLKRYDGVYRWLISDGSPRHDSKGEFIGFIGHCLDNTERKKAEEKIKKLNRLYAVLSEINKVIVRSDDQQELFDKACRIAVEAGGFGFCWIGITDIEHDRVVPAAQYGFSENIFDVINISLSPDKPEGRGPTGTALREGKYNICNDIEKDERMLPWREEILKRGYRSLAAFPLTRASYTYGIIIFYSSQPEFFNEEEVKLLDELSSDISYCIETIEHEKQKQKIEEERDRFFNYSIDMMCIIEFKGHFAQLNPAWEKTLGWSNEELMAKPFIEIVHPEDRKSTLEAGEKLMKHKHIISNYLNRIMCRDGTYKWLSWNLVTLSEGNQIFAVTRDVTEIVKNEIERKKLETQLIQAQKLESLGTMAGGIAHDFNNILNIIIGYASMLKSSDVDKNELLKSIETILDASWRGAGLVKQLLTFARKSESVFQSVQVNDIIAEIEKLLGETFPKTIEINSELQEDLPPIIGDSTQIHQIFLNLCVNARDAMQKGGTITIATKHVNNDIMKIKNPEAVSGDYIEIQVKDTGTGMDETVKQKIFDPFFTTKETGKGTGLGLAMVYGIIKNHGGSIDLISEVGKGTTFYIYLPAQKQAPEIQQDIKKINEDIPQGTGTILLIEDEKVSSELLTIKLVLKGYKVITTYDGLQGILAYQNHVDEIDVVITDHGLPLLNGEGVSKQIKTLNPKAKIIMTSGFIDPETKAKLFEAGVRHIIQKPFTPEKILQKIYELIEEK